VEEIRRRFEKSELLPACLRLYKQYRDSCSQIFLSDFEEYLVEIGPEDFQTPDENEIYLSTLHKVKGLEFDDVYLALDMASQSDREGERKITDEMRRVIYVGMTRARHSLCLYSVAERYEKKIDPSPFLREIFGGLKDREAGAGHE
jgi:superfamily I DNA/RNA helicase